MTDEFGNEDLLIGMLLEMGTSGVTLHRFTPSAAAVKILRAVFRVKVCGGCSLCRQNIK